MYSGVTAVTAEGFGQLDAVSLAGSLGTENAAAFATSAPSMFGRRMVPIVLSTILGILLVALGTNSSGGETQGGQCCGEVA